MADHRCRTPARRAPPKVDSETLSGLARAAVRGFRDKRESFLKGCRQYAYDAAKRLGRNHQGAEDSAQEALIVNDRMLDLQPAGLDPGSVGAFVRTVVLRQVNEVARRRLLEVKAMRELPAPRHEAPDVAGEVETQEWERRVRAAVDTLPQPGRRLIDLRYVEGLSTRQIAREVGRSQRSIIRLLRAAEAALKDKLRALRISDDPARPEAAR